MATYEGGNAEGPPGRHPARGARTGAGPRLCDHGSAAGAHRRPGRPAHRHDLPGVAPAGAGRLGAGSLVSGWRAAAPGLSADPRRPARPGGRAQHRAGRFPPPPPPASGPRAAAAHAAAGDPVMTTHRPPEPRVPAVERYLAEITARLPGPREAHVGIVAELHSGLLDAADAYQSAGLAPSQAAQAAIREFGDPARVAAGFSAEIAARQARRAAVILLVPGPLVGLLWIATALASPLGIRLTQLWHWAGLPPGLRVTMALVAVAAGVTFAAALLGIATTGRLTRWLPARPRRAP